MVAAPGWGKTALLRTIAGAVPSIEVSRPPAGWTPFSLARQLADALGRLAPDIDDDLPAHAAPDSPDNPDQSVALAATVCTIAARVVDEDTVLVIDDVDAPDGDPLHQFLEALVLHLPARLHLVLACRKQPVLRIARLRAAGEVARVGPPDLAICAADMSGLDASAATTVDEIARMTGGWPLAVQLAAEVLRRVGPIDHSALVDRLLAPDAVLFEYLAEEVLAGAAEGERELLSIAVRLPQVSPVLLEEIGRPDLVTHLAPLGDTGIFLDRDMSITDLYRPSALGGEFVRRVLPAPPETVLRAAVAAFVRLGEIESALVLCTDVGDPELALDVVLDVERPDRLRTTEALAGALRLAGRSGEHPRVAELQGDLGYLRGEWDDALRAYQLAMRLGDTGSPRLARKRGVIFYLRGLLDDAEAAYERGRVDGSEPAEEAQLLAWHAAIRWIRADIDGCEALLERAEVPAKASGDDAALATLHTTRAMVAAMRGDRRTNAEEYRRALVHAERAGDVVQLVRIHTNRGSHYSEEGNYQQALAVLDEAIEIAELIGSETFGHLAYYNRGETYFRIGRLDDALRDLHRAQQMWERLGSDDVGYALTQLGDVQLLRGQRSEAVALYRQAIELSERRGNMQSLVPALIGVAKALVADDPTTAAAAAERAVAASTAVAMPHALAAAGWVALRSGRRDEAIARAVEAVRVGQAHQDRPAVAEALLLQAAAETPVSPQIAEEARRMWQDLGSPIGEARAALLIAETTSGRERDHLVADAEQRLFDAGALGYLADARRARSNGSPVAITTLGGFRVSRDGVPIDVGDWGSRKARDLLKLLVARRGAPVVRDEAATLLWPDESDRSSRRLSVLLSTIRSTLDPRKSKPADHYVAADHDTAWLVREHVDVDVELFLRETAEARRLLATGEPAKAEALLTQATARYLGEFCADDPYADWTAGLRELARHTFVEAAAALASIADERGDPAEAVRQRLRILDVDPYDEFAHLSLIRSLSAQRRHGEARRAYRNYCTRLAELDVDPAPFPN